jgi:hypothetical protein
MRFLISDYSSQTLLLFVTLLLSAFGDGYISFQSTQILKAELALG